LSEEKRERKEGKHPEARIKDDQEALIYSPLVHYIKR
jgi:hypothetical protein